jgi:hypothetical protein
VCYEWKHLTRQAYHAAARRLVDFGYQLAPAGGNMFAVRPSSSIEQRAAGAPGQRIGRRDMAGRMSPNLG